MRILVLLKGGKHYVAWRMHSVELGNPFVSFDLVGGGVVRVPLDNVEAVEEYDDHQTERFRQRLSEIVEPAAS